MKERIDSFERVLIELAQNLFPGVEVKGIVLVLITALVATILAAVAIFIIKMLTSWVEKRITNFHSRKLRHLKFQNQEILTSEQVALGLGKLLTWLRYFAYLIVFYLYINIIFSFFPETRGISAALLEHFINAVKFVLGAVWAYIPNLITLIVIGVFGYYATRLTRVFFKGIEDGRISISGFYSDWAAPTFTIARVFIIVFVIIVAFPYLPGKESPAFQAVSIFLGILVSLGSTGAVSNVVSGIALTYMRAFKNGDSVRIADTAGDVIEKTMFVTRIRTNKNVEITVPNAMVLNNHIINYSALAENEGLILHTKVTIGYDVPWRQVHELLKEAAVSTEDVQREPEPFVLQTALNDFYVEYEINAYTRKPNQMSRTYNELHRNIQDKFHEAGIEIASPSLMAFKDGGKDVPVSDDEYLPKDYNPPKTGLWPFTTPGKKP